jgi:hypothetical protein
MDCKHVKREGESCPKNNKCKYPDCLKQADAEFQSKKEAAKENTDLAYDLYRSYVGSAETQEERLRRIQMFRRG